MLKKRRSHDSLIFNMEIPIPGKDGLYIEMGPWCSMFIQENMNFSATHLPFCKIDYH